MRRWLYILAALLVFPALLINLGLMVFIDDEAIRSLVAREMLWSGNYVAPTMHGDAYLNKPPLWNWLLALSFTLHGEVSEWAARLPTVIGLLGFALTTYLFSRRHFSNYLAVIHALTVITCGRMLFWDSMLALIDVTFSAVVYLQLMLLHHYSQDGRWWRAFGWAYFLTAVGFMLKGLPAIVFQGISVIVTVAWRRNWLQLVRPAHLVSGLGCLALLALYYWQYASYVDLPAVAERLLVESSKRTAVAHGGLETVEHVLTFPFEMGYHFLPWTLLLVYLLQPGSWKILRTNDFAAYCLVLFVANIPVYWLSPNVYPRYLLMLFPLLFASLLWLHQVHEKRNTRSYRGLRYLLLGAMSLCALALPFIPLIPETEIVDFRWGKSLIVGGAAGALAVLAWRSERNTLLIFCCFLLVLRIGFNFFLLPPRAAGDERGLAVRNTAIEVVENNRAEKLAIFRHTLIEPATGYYLTVARGEVIRRELNNYDSTTVYIGAADQYPELRIAATDSLYLRHKNLRYPVGRLLDYAREEREEELLDGMGTGISIK